MNSIAFYFRISCRKLQIKLAYVIDQSYSLNGTNIRDAVCVIIDATT